MQYGHVPGIDKPISRLVQGTVMFSAKKLDWGLALLDGIYGLGCNTFDTAHGYGSGESERVLGQWLKTRGVRDQVVVITKGCHPNADRKRVTPYDLTSDLHDSLARLQSDYIDLYLLHRDDPAVPVGPLVETLNEHKAAGKIRAFGGSNWSQRRLIEVNEYAATHGLTPFAASSPNFSLAEAVKEPWPDCISISADHEARAWYEQNQMPLFAWSSFAGGFFSGRFRRDNLDTFDQYLDKVCVASYCYEDNFKRLERAQQMAQEKGISVPQVAMAYVLSQPLNLFALVGCNTADEFADNLRALEIRLTAEEMGWLESGSSELKVKS